MVEGLDLIAEIDCERATDDEDDFKSVTLGEVGYAHCALVYKKEWAAFKQLIAEIDAEWAI
jgi:hypothetical protein